jgi:tetratricopeptide (TPR) repeat protein
MSRYDTYLKTTPASGSKALFLFFSALAWACLPAASKAAPTGIGGVVAPGSLANQELTEDQLQQGLTQLKTHLLRRGEEQQYVDLFANDIQKISADADSNGLVPVTRQVFDAFIKYEVAWASKVRDSLNPSFPSDQLQRETNWADALKKEFQSEAHNASPLFYAAFQAAVNDVKQARGGSAAASMFGGQTNNSYSNVDAGQAALQAGDTTTAAADASQAIAADPDNSEAYSLQAAADMAQGDNSAAAQAASTALQLDPGNQQAQAVLALSGSQAPSSPGALADAASAAAGLSGGAAAAGASKDDGIVAVSVPLGGPAPSPAAPSPGAGGAAAPPAGLSLAPTAAQKALQSADITRQAQVAVRLGDPLNAIGQLNQAIALNPMNTQALNLRAIALAHDHQYSAALQDINRSLMVAPHNSATLDAKSAISNRAKDYAGALSAAGEALRIDARDARAFFHRAHALAGLGDRAGMLEALRQAAKLDPAYDRTLQAALKLSPSADLTSLFPDRETLQAAAERQAAARRRASPWKKFLRRTGLQSVLDEFGALSALAAVGLFLLVLMYLLSRSQDADVPPKQPLYLG